MNDNNVSEIGSDNIISMIQEFSCTSNWTAVSSIVLTTNSIPISSTITLPPQVFSSTQIVNTNDRQTINAISDFTVILDTGVEYLPSVSYAPSYPRYIDMKSHKSLDTIDIAVRWRDVYGNIRPLYLYPGCQCDIKIALVSKDFAIN